LEFTGWFGICVNDPVLNPIPFSIPKFWKTLENGIPFGSKSYFICTHFFLRIKKDRYVKNFYRV
jgi:hypothetical protein